MTDNVPHVLEHAHEARVAITLDPPYTDITVQAIDNGSSEFNYVNEKWALRRGMVWETGACRNCSFKRHHLPICRFSLSDA
jgi:hypothetical protein